MSNNTDGFKYRSQQRGPRSDCSYRSSLICVHTVCHRGFLKFQQTRKRSILVTIGLRYYRFGPAGKSKYFNRLGYAWCMYDYQAFIDIKISFLSITNLLTLPYFIMLSAQSTNEPGLMVKTGIY